MCAEVQAPAVPPVTHIKLAFYTIGDNRDANSPPDLQLTIEEMWRRRAELLAPGHVHGVHNLASAEAVLNGLADGELIEEIFFLGHGGHEEDDGTGNITNLGFFFFSGHPDPEFDFTVTNNDQILGISRHDLNHILPDEPDNPDIQLAEQNKSFLFKLFKKLSKSIDLVRINFLACYMGKGETHTAICDYLDGWLLGLSEVEFKVGAFTHFYETVFVTDQHGHIVHFEDHIVDFETDPTTEVVANPGPNQIPAFERRCDGTMVGTL